MMTNWNTKLTLIIIFISFSAFAKEIDTTIKITGRVYMPTCVVNNGAGLNQYITMGHYSPSEIINGNLKYIGIPIFINCQSSPLVKGVRVSLSSNKKILDKDSIISTDLNGVFLELKWKDGQDVKLSGSRVFNNYGSDIDASLKVRVLKSNSSENDIDKGNFQSSLDLELTYL